MDKIVTPALVLYIAMSADGYIAAENDNIDFLNDYHVEGEDYGYSEFLNSVETILVGRKTYQKVLNMGFPYHENKSVYVISRTIKEVPTKTLTFYSGDLVSLCTQLKTCTVGNIYCDGGAELAKTLISLGLIDKIILSVVPVLLEKGTLLFENAKIPNEFNLKNRVNFTNGLVQFEYEKTVNPI